MNDNRRVYRIPVVYSIKAYAYVLTDNLKAAEQAARGLDYEDLIGLTPETVHTSEIRRLKFDDVVISVVDISGIGALAPAQYTPNRHPDFVGHPEK